MKERFFFYVLFSVLTVFFLLQASPSEAADYYKFFKEPKNLSQWDEQAFYPAIAVTNDGEIMVVFVQNNDIWYTISKNGGATWSGPSLGNRQ
ncbi:sialidase family protein [Acidobacteriota bacterium]